MFALVSLMGLYLSEAYGHPKVYKELIAYVDDGHELTLDKFLPNPPSDASADGDAADDDCEDAELHPLLFPFSFSCWCGSVQGFTSFRYQMVAPFF